MARVDHSFSKVLTPLARNSGGRPPEFRGSACQLRVVQFGTGVESVYAIGTAGGQSLPAIE